MNLGEKNTTHIRILQNKVCRNINRIHNLAQACNVNLRPHFKTHQSEEVAKLFTDAGIYKITVSSLNMAKQFCISGYRDILIAIPFNPIECDNLISLLDEYHPELTVLLDDFVAAQSIIAALHAKVKYAIKVDTGYGRAGIHYHNIEAIFRMVNLLKEEQLTDRFYGFVSHFGHTYSADSKMEIIEINQIGISALRTLKLKVEEKFNLSCAVSVGDTPSLGCYDKKLLQGVEEIRPGNFVYYDAMQMLAGHCTIQDIGMVLMAPVLALYPERNEVLVHAGAVHLSKEHLQYGEKNIFGIPVFVTPEGEINIFEHAFVDRLSQEHGIIRFLNGIPASIACKMFVGIIPVHSCLCISCMKNQC